ncbi:hypothetical protein ABPG73_016982, partial [Tetrahymena malaccensis]
MNSMLEEIIKNKNYPIQHVKKLLAIQKLEAFNFMHSKNTLHRGIKIQNPLIQQINRLCNKNNIYKYSFKTIQNNCQLKKDDVGLVSVISILRSYKNSMKSFQAHFSYKVEKGFFRIQVKDHLQVFRLAILKIDYQIILYRQSILHEELTEIYQEKEILSNIQVQLTPKFNILKKDQTYLVQNYQKTRLTSELSNILNNSKLNKLYLMIYSAILL